MIPTSYDWNKLQAELELARQIQFSLLPKVLPNVQGLDLWASSQAATAVGGDYYDFISKPDTPLTVVIGDISGKGVPAALLMNITRSIIRSVANEQHRPTPGEIISRANALLYDDFTRANMFATVFIGRYQPGSRLVSYANAGHSPIIYRAAHRKAVLLKADGPPLGIYNNSFSKERRLNLHGGEVLVAGTDGLSEARNTEDQQFGHWRLLELIDSLYEQPARIIGESLQASVWEFTGNRKQDDDQTLIVMKWADIRTLD